MPGLKWSPTKIEATTALTAYYKWPQPDEADPVCSTCPDLGPYTVNPNKEADAELTCKGWASDKYDAVGGFTIKSDDICVFKCNAKIVANVICRQGNWTVNLEDGFYCFNKPGEAVDGGWGAFTKWSDCSSKNIIGFPGVFPAGTCTQSRSRKCDSPTPINGGQTCDGPGTEVKKCTGEKCTKVDGGWGSYTKWSTCNGKIIINFIFNY